MKILIHALGATMGGAMRHLSNFLPELGRQDQSNEYVVLVRESLPLACFAENIRIVKIKDKTAESWWARIGYDVFLLPGELKKGKYSCIVSLTNFGPIRASTSHVFFQGNSIYYCPRYLERVNGRLKMETYWRRKLALASMMRADLIVTPSQAMADMIREMCPETASRPFKVLYHGFTKESLQDPLDQKYEDLLSSRNGIRLLYPTHPAPHKGFDTLFAALKLLKKNGLDYCLFTTVCRDDWPVEVARYERQIAKLGLENQVVFTGRVPQRQMGSLYTRCHLMVYPSLCESFGFSMIEAMGNGLPVVAAATPVNVEICGDGATYFSPFNPEECAKAILEALEPYSSAKLVAGGKARLDSFDWGWERYTREFVGLVRGVL